MIDQKLRAKNKERLLKERKRLETLLSRIAKKDGKDFRAKYPEFGTKDDENASEFAAYETNIAEEFDLEQKLRKVEAALERIASRTYGICLVGGEPLPRHRLEAVPEAETCVQHAASK